MSRPSISSGLTECRRQRPGSSGGRRGALVVLRATPSRIQEVARQQAIVVFHRRPVGIDLPAQGDPDGDRFEPGLAQLRDHRAEVRIASIPVRPGTDALVAPRQGEDDDTRGGERRKAREALVEQRLAPLAFDARSGLRLRQNSPDDATHDGAQWRSIGGVVDVIGCAAGVVAAAGSVSGCSPAISTGRPKARATSISAASSAGAATELERLVALDGGQRVAPYQSLVEPMPERLANAEPVRHPLDDEAVGDPGVRRPSIEQVERVVVQVVRFDGGREPGADRDDIGPLAGAGCPGRVEDNAHTPGHRRRCVSGGRHERSRVRRSSTASEVSRAGSDWLWEPVSYPNAQPRNAGVTGQLRARVRRSPRLGALSGSARVRPGGPPRRRPGRCPRSPSGSANELGCDQLAQPLMAKPRPNDGSDEPFDYRRESRRAEIESTIRALASPDRKWSSRNALRATGSGGHGSSSAPSNSAASWTGRATLAWI